MTFVAVVVVFVFDPFLFIFMKNSQQLDCWSNYLSHIKHLIFLSHSLSLLEKKNRFNGPIRMNY